MVKWSRVAAQCVLWAISAALTVFIVLPWLIVFWLWELITDYSGTVNPVRATGQDSDPSRSALWGTSRFVHLKDVTLHYVEAGDRSKPLMVCLHGFPESWYSWRHQLKEFSSTHWVVALDMRGYGDSDKPAGRDHYRMDLLVGDVCQFIQKLGRKNCVLLAHDWGGAIGWHVVHQHPNLVSQYIAMNIPHPAAFKSTISSEYAQVLKSWYMIFFQLPVIPELLLTAFNGLFFRHLIHRKNLRSKNIRPQDIRANMELFRKPSDLTGPINYYRNIVDMLSEDPTLMRITVPTLLIWGDEDDYLSASMAVLSSKWVDDFTLGMINGASHWVQQDAPDIVNEKIRNFLTS